MELALAVIMRFHLIVLLIVFNNVFSETVPNIFNGISNGPNGLCGMYPTLQDYLAELERPRLSAEMFFVSELVDPILNTNISIDDQLRELLGEKEFNRFWARYQALRNQQRSA